MTTLLISGTNKGLGLAMTKESLACGYTVYAGFRDSRNNHDLEKLALQFPETCFPIKLDIQSTESIKLVVEKILMQGGQIDVLINNAGINCLGSFEDLPRTAWQKIFETNFFGTIALTRAVLPHMREQRSGQIVMISSLSALIGLPGNSVYAASKAALEAAAESLRYEVQNFGITVYVIEIGAYRTQLALSTNLPDDYPVNSTYQPIIDYQQQSFTEQPARGADPQEAGTEIIKLIKGDHLNRFRHSVGEQAKTVCKQLKELDDKQRTEFVREVSGLDWWMDNRESPTS